MEVSYLLDSNALIDYFAESMPPASLDFLDDIFNSGTIIMSVITHIEVLGFQAPDDYLQRFQKLINVSTVIPLADAALIEKAILIRRETKIKLPDAVIAATALVHKLTIISRNEKDFDRVDGLNCINPHRM